MGLNWGEPFHKRPSANLKCSAIRSRIFAMKTGLGCGLTQAVSENWLSLQSHNAYKDTESEEMVISHVRSTQDAGRARP
ncbi:hypothetical protein PoB_006440900 [Plakobranchus ocellatus]|uniref:Uncharacterized protein n=1 Tax=Plakobranchus ocellatus TaxID=259542 RepID=A0AAV4D170_9GAST|nr:hypothetical protein PoB_006440900 [Plakobranchus ocellatus]